MAELGPDASIMLRHDWATLGTLPWHRQVAALFTADLRDAVMSVIESALVADGFHDPRAAVTGTFNAWGDHVGHTAALGAENQPVLARFVPYHPDGKEVRDGYGTRELAAFLDWAAAHGVRTIGGVPTGFVDSPILLDALAAIRAVYAAHGAGFLALPNLSRYPRTDFFDTADHLNEAAQIQHSEAVARALKPLLDETSVTVLTPGPTP
jgi:hypothetical protein